MITRDANAVEPLDEAVDHVRGPSARHLILEYGDYECPYSRAADRQIQRVQKQAGDVRFAFRHFPLTGIHPHALAASAAAEAAARQGPGPPAVFLRSESRRCRSDRHVPGWTNSGRIAPRLLLDERSHADAEPTSDSYRRKGLRRCGRRR